METLTVGNAKLTWLQGGVTHMDGGAMFGVVPKPLWSKKYPVNDRNQIELRTDPILLELSGKRYLIDAGIGNDKLTEKQLRNFGVCEESSIDRSLSQLGLSTASIDAVLMTHMHFDHASGLTKWDGEELVPTFENATIYVSQVEWEEVTEPNMRSVNTYWEDNWRPIKHQVKTFSHHMKIDEGLGMWHTSGHSNGHAIIRYIDEEHQFIHMADLMPTHAHRNPLWVLAYDDYPVTSVHEKKRWLDEAIKEGAWLTFYHDAIYRAVQFNEKGEHAQSVAREQYAYPVHK
ncbi:hypothetical protein N781_09195 [Pontibacillus halophilus JSM 076056 = DSM 19796]|uniref:Metallo-beta-lactamase domain-containing protein n=1 Tax=Pontibacillus halophilus JSM 076056 = DSM 19796 TaxID=1385510 RepID=A0A0A5G8F1_9BACI|nr:MBL fold metallo-hydrolase [Pontibacillus halophilus]KGX89416.1 hypothetical protein N781_09195 [Pontibacillus halophilus JSM 076056 = DSM 19796]